MLTEVIVAAVVLVFMEVAAVEVDHGGHGGGGG